MRYRDDLDVVLKGLSFKTERNMKVGIVGRTGAGKSILIQALFRLVECDTSSRILIDGIDNTKVGLKTLRNSISVIP